MKNFIKIIFSLFILTLLTWCFNKNIKNNTETWSLKLENNVKDNMENIEIPSDFFKTNLEEKKYEDEENMFKWFSESLNYFDGLNYFINKNIYFCIFEDKCFFEKQDYIDLVTALKWDFENEKAYYYREIIKKFNIEIDKEKSKNLEWVHKINSKKVLKNNLNLFLEEEKSKRILNFFLSLSEKKYYKYILNNGNRYDYSIKLIYFSDYIMIKNIFLMENKKEKEFLENTEKFFDILNKIYNWDNLVLNNQSIFSAYEIQFKSFEKILDKYEVSKDIKEKLIEIIEKIDTKSKLENSLKVDYKINIENLKYLFENENEFKNEEEYKEISKKFEQIFFELINWKEISKENEEFLRKKIYLNFKIEEYKKDFENFQKNKEKILKKLKEGN